MPKPPVLTARPFVWLTVMRFTTRKAFTLFEMLLVTFIIGSLALLAYSSWPQNDYRHYYFMDDYLTLQARAMADNAEYLLENAYDYAASSPIRFTEDGTVNRGQTLNFPFGDVIIHLGNGSISYE